MKTFGGWCITILCMIMSTNIRADHDHGEHHHIFEQLNKIFYWELADKLKLDTGSEKKMVGLIQRCQTLREAALQKHDKGYDCLRKLEKRIESAKDKTINKDAEASKCLKIVDSAEDELAKIRVNENKKLRAMFSPYQLGKFKILRGDIIKNVRKAISKK